jgi:hypothetical protein
MTLTAFSPFNLPLLKFCGCRATVGSALSYDMESVCVDCLPMFSLMHERSYTNFLKNMTKTRTEAAVAVEDLDDEEEEDEEALEKASAKKIAKLLRSRKICIFHSSQP